MIKIETIFERDESLPGHPVKNTVKPSCQWVIDGEGRPTRKYDGMNVRVINGELHKRKKPRGGDYTMASYVPCDRSDPADKYLWEAFDTASIAKVPDGIYEAIGPKIQGNPEGVMLHRLIPIPAGTAIEENPRTFDELRDYLSTHNIEGIVFHHADGRMAKIKKRDFGLERQAKLQEGSLVISEEMEAMIDGD